MFWGILLRLDWEPLREGRLKVARGRSWQPEIGMEHASRGRRSGNKGVGARWRGRFRIFSARHRSRTEVSHAENSGMTTVFFFGDCSGVGGSGSGSTPPCGGAGEGLGGDWGILSHAQERRHEGFLFGGFFCGWTGSRCGSMCWPVDRPATHAAAGAAARGALIFLFFGGGLSHAREWMAREG